MTSKWRRSVSWFLLLLLFASGCERSSSSGPNKRVGPPIVATVNYPLTFFTEQIAGTDVVIKFPVTPGEDPDFWQPDDDAIAEFQNADRILLNGSGYAAWTESVSLPDERIVDTSSAFRDKYLKLAEAIVHKHGPEGEHAHEGLATLTWLDPQQARQQAKAVYGSLVPLLPAKKEELHNRWMKLDEQLAGLENELRELPEPTNNNMLASHPVYDYLSRYCGWNLKSMHWEPHESPSEEEWKKFSELLETHAANIMLWEAPPTEETQKRLEQMGITCVTYYPCGNRPEAGDYLSVMRENIGRLKAALEKAAEQKTN